MLDGLLALFFIIFLSLYAIAFVYSCSWPVIKGDVIDFVITSAKSSVISGLVIWRVYVLYKYSVNGKEYVSKRERLLGGRRRFKTQIEAEIYLEDTKKNLMVKYCPVFPSISFIK